MKLDIVFAAAVVTLGLLSGCGKSPAPLEKLTCQDNPTGRPKAEQQVIADACALGGKNTPSSNKKW